jgi:ribosome biogenesis protein MAK21
MPKTLGSEGDLTDSDAVPSGLEDGASDLEDSGDEDDNGDIDNNHEDRDDEGLGSDDALSLMEGSDNEDLLPFEGLIEYDGSDAETSDGAGEDWTGIGAVDGRKRKREEDTAVSKGRNGKKKKALPTFASYEEYAKIIEDGPEDNL